MILLINKCQPQWDYCLSNLLFGDPSSIENLWKENVVLMIKDFICDLCLRQGVIVTNHSIAIVKAMLDIQSYLLQNEKYLIEFLGLCHLNEEIPN